MKRFGALPRSLPDDVARACRKHPMLLDMLRDGRLHLSGIATLAPHLTPANRKAVLKSAVHRSKRQIEEIVAKLNPRPEAPTVVRKVPASRRGNGPAGPGPQNEGGRTTLAQDGEHRPDDTGPVSLSNATGSADAPGRERRRDDVPTAPAPTPAPASRLEPVAPARFRVHFDASAELCEKLERLQALKRSSTPSVDLGTVIDEAVTRELERVEAQRFGRTKAPRKSLAETDTTPRTRYIPAAVRRRVTERDGDRCTFRDRHGRRCPKRHDLEFHHRTPFGRGGGHTPENLALVCKVHNTLIAEQDYGKENMAQYRRSPDRVSEPIAVYGVGQSSRLPPGTHTLTRRTRPSRRGSRPPAG